MAFTQANLHKVLDLGANNSLWHYFDAAADGAATIDTTAYFTGDAVRLLRIGDIILRVTPSGTSGGVATGITTVGFHVVNANNGTTVDVTDTLALTMTDTD